jgi:hypothetical protein
MLGTTFVGCVVAVAAVAMAGGVGETSTTSRSALGSNVPSALALHTAKAANPAKVAPKVNIGTATQIIAGASVSVDPGVDPQLVDRALNSLGVDWQSVANGWSIVFKKPRNGFLGLTLVREHRVEIYVRANRSLGGLTHDIAHELGHVADVTTGSDESRSAFLAARHLSLTTPWWTCSGCTDLQVGAGDFAETFALLAAPPFRFYSELGVRPTEGELNDVVATLPSPIVQSLSRP